MRSARWHCRVIGRRTLLRSIRRSSLQRARRAMPSSARFRFLAKRALKPRTLAPKLPSVAAPTTREMLSWERETLGIFVSGHPLAEVAPLLARAGAMPIKELRDLQDDAAVTVAGTVTGGATLAHQGRPADSGRAARGYNGALRRRSFLENLSSSSSTSSQTMPSLSSKGVLRLRERPGAAPGDEPRIELSVAANEVALRASCRRVAWRRGARMARRRDSIAIKSIAWRG